jgi:hypothetical protein
MDLKDYKVDMSLFYDRILDVYKSIQEESIESRPENGYFYLLTPIDKLIFVENKVCKLKKYTYDMRVVMAANTASFSIYELDS